MTRPPTDGHAGTTVAPNISEIRLENLEIIHRGRRNVLYRSQDKDRPVVVKVATGDLPNAGAGASLRHEYELLHGLDLPGVARVLGFSRAGTGLVLLLEDAGESNLAQRIGAGPLSITEFLEVAVQIAETVKLLHQARIVHRDLNPSNIVWDAGSGRATIVDFGISTTLAELVIESTAPSQLEGTLAYISPEQTGRTGRAVDSRTDLYSLGATFYELLTGSPTFKAQDSLELIHAHLARLPRAPRELRPDVPLVLSQIVLKLLEKEPEQRYQTAGALAADLREAKVQWARSGSIEPFPLADHDVSNAMSIPNKLYGRDGDIRTLTDAFSRACEGPRRFVLVTGDPGVGKSALVGQLEQPVLERRGFFISGKFDQLQRTVPYAGLVQALRMLVRRLLTEPEPVLVTWRDRIEAAVAPNGQVLVGVIPEVELIIGPQPAVSELGAVESKNRFNLVFTAFLRVLARPEHPLVLFLDDLQWIDAGSLQLLEQWMADAQARYLLLLGAYRDAEVGAEHPLTRSLAEIRGGGTTLEEIHLSPIGREDIARLVADTLKQDTAQVHLLADVIAKKTAGNPFFIRQLVHTLHAEELIHFSARTRAWEWDLSAVEQAPLSDNVLGLMVQTIERLPVDTRQLLEAAACIGHRFDLGQLAEVTGRSRTEAARHLWPALEDGLLVPLGDAYKVPRSKSPIDESLGGLQETVQFVHDRVQQAAYSFLTEARRRSLHLDIGRRLLKGTSPDALDGQRLFDIVDQLNLGESLVEDPLEHLRLAELNLAAGRKAKASAAYQAAFNYLTVGRRHLQDRAWEEHGVLAFSIHRELAECAYLTGQHAKAEEFVHVAMEHAPSRKAKVELYGLRALAATDTGDYARALGLGREALALFAHAWPLERLPEAIEVEAAAVMENVRGRRFDALAQEAEVLDEETRVCMQLLCVLAAPAYFSSEGNVLQFVIMRLVNLSLVQGPSPFSAYGYNFYGALHNARTGDYGTGHAFGRLALALARRFGNRGEECRVLEVFGLIVNPWKAPLRDNVAIFKEGHRAGIESGELQYAAYNLVALLINGLPLGVPLPEFLKDVEASLAFSTKHKNKGMIEFSLPFRQGARSLTGRTRNRATFDDDEFEEARFFAEAKNVTALAFYWVIRLQAAYLFADYQNARKYSEAAKKVLASALGMVVEGEHVFYTALTLAALHQSAPSGEKPALMEELLALNARLSTWAGHCPENFRHKEQLVRAEVARLTGELWQAQQLYAEATASAAREGFMQDEALANELRGRLALAHGEPGVAGLFLRAAKVGYSRWGATEKVRALEELYPFLVATAEVRTSGTPSGSSPELALDALGLIKASQAISAETSPARLFERILRITIEVAGAQKGILLLGEPGELKIRAQVGAEKEMADRLEEVPLADAGNLSRAIVRYVARLNEPLVLTDAMMEGPFTTDPDVRGLRSRSVACIPLKKQARVIGLLYLENNAMAGAFTQERVGVVEVLAAQAVISLENQTYLLERMRIEQQLSMQKQTLELTLKEAPLETVLNLLLRLVESQSEKQTFASILLMDSAGRRLLRGAAPSLPEAFNQALHGIEIGPSAGSCGTAAHRQESVIVSDIAADPLWTDWRALALSHELRSCWSTPIFSSRGKLLGTFALYRKIPGRPSRQDLQLVELATQTAAVILERQLAERERQAAGHALRESEEQARLALNGGRMGTWSIRLPGNTLVSDARFREMHGVSEHEDVEEAIDRQGHPDDRARIREALGQAIARNEPYVCEYRIVQPDGSYQWIYARGEPKFDEKTRQPVSISGVAFDINERKKAESALHEAVRARDEFLSIASHELKTPLTSLKLQTQSVKRLIKKGDPAVYSPERVKRLVEQTDKQADRLLRLVDDMLDIARIQTGNLSLTISGTDLCALVVDTVERLQPQFEAVQTSVTTTCCDPVWIDLDRDRIEQVVVNLLTNALRYGNKRPVNVDVRVSGPNARISVADQGIGIAKENQARVFKRFERAISENEVSGLGLGLYISKQIVERHGGRVFLESMLGEGATFTVELPLSDQGLARGTAAAMKAKEDAHGG